MDKILATGTFGAHTVEGHLVHGVQRVFLKWKDQSYLHAQWVDAKEIRTGRGTAKLQKFLQKESEEQPWMDFKAGHKNDDYFDAEYVSVDRILDHRPKFKISQ